MIKGVIFVKNFGLGQQLRTFVQKFLIPDTIHRHSHLILKTPPRHLQDASKTLQEASKTALRPPKTPPRRLWTAQRRLQAAPSCFETPQECHKIETFEKSLNFHRFSFDFSSFFMLSGFPWRGKGQTPLSKQFIC